MSKPTQTQTVATVARRILALLDEYPPDIQRGAMGLVSLSSGFDHGVSIPVHVVPNPETQARDFRRFVGG